MTDENIEQLKKPHIFSLLKHKVHNKGPETHEELSVFNY